MNKKSLKTEKKIQLTQRKMPNNFKKMNNNKIEKKLIKLAIKIKYSI